MSITRLYQRASGALRQFGPLGFITISASLPALAIARRIDRDRWERPDHLARIDAETRRQLAENQCAYAGQAVFSDQADYGSYLDQQLTKSLRLSAKFNLEKRLNLFFHRYWYPKSAMLVRVVDIAAAAANGLGPTGEEPPRILAIGCRDELEIVVLERLFRSPDITGIDIYSLGPKIRAGDMHALDRADHSTDVVVSCHSLEHSYDPRKALAEFIRVLRPGGILAIEVPGVSHGEDGPIPFSKEHTDRWDFCNLPSLVRTVREVAGGEITILHALDDVPRRGIMQLVAQIPGDAGTGPHRA